MQSSAVPLLSVGLYALCSFTSLWAQAPEGSSPKEEKTLSEEQAVQRKARMKWWKEARFGMFVHWGLYSGLGGEWKGEPVSSDRHNMEWIQQWAGADTYEYAHEAYPHFQPKADFAKAWAELAKTGGCRYLVFTSKHHDGFALHDSAVTTYDAKDLVGRDLVAEIVEACREEGLKVGFYHSVIDWHHPQYDYTAAKALSHPLKGRPSPNGPRDHSLYLKHLHSQVEELMTQYGPVDVLWWDFSKKGAEGEFWKADELMSMVRAHQPQIVSNNRLYHIPSLSEAGNLKAHEFDYSKGDFTTPEQSVPDEGLPGIDWELCMTMNGTWGFGRNDQKWKSSQKLIQTLVEVVSKGGNFLLNIGPKGDGSIPPESVQLMEEIGAWMAVNGESIYGTEPSGLPAPEWGRYTAKPGLLYAHVLEWPGEGKLALPVAASAISAVELLQAGRPVEVSFEPDGEGVVLHLPEQAPHAAVSVLKIKKSS